jgi:hypothetical protein
MSSDLQSIFTAVKGSLNVAEKLNQRKNRIQIEQAIQSLKQIVFLPSEVRSTIQAISKGKVVNTADAKRLAEYFGQIDDAMAETLKYLEPRRFEENESFGTQDMFLLDQVRNGKLSARIAVSDLLLQYVNSVVEDKSLGHIKSQANQLLKSINSLNKDIAKTEKRLVVLKRGR